MLLEIDIAPIVNNVYGITPSGLELDYQTAAAHVMKYTQMAETEGAVYDCIEEHTDIDFQQPHHMISISKRETLPSTVNLTGSKESMVLVRTHFVSPKIEVVEFEPSQAGEEMITIHLQFRYKEFKGIKDPNKPDIFVDDKVVSKKEKEEIMRDRACYRFTFEGNLQLDELLLTIQETGKCRPNLMDAKGRMSKAWRIHQLPKFLKRKKKKRKEESDGKKKPTHIIPGSEFILHTTKIWRKIDESKGECENQRIDYLQLPPIVHIIGKLELGQTRGHVHTMKIKPMVNGICQSGCGFTHQLDPMKCHSDLVFLPLKECPYRDTIGDDDSNFQVYCPHACGKVICERGSFIRKQNTLHDCLGAKIRGFSLTPDFVKEHSLHYDILHEFTEKWFVDGKAIDPLLEEKSSDKTWADRAALAVYRSKQTMMEARLAEFNIAQMRKANAAQVIDKQRRARVDRLYATPAPLPHSKHTIRTPDDASIGSPVMQMGMARDRDRP